MLRRGIGVIASGATALLGGQLAPQSGEAADTDGARRTTESDGSETTTARSGEQETSEAVSDGDRRNVIGKDAVSEAAVSGDETFSKSAVAEELYDVHSDRCMCPACGGSPPGSP